MRRGAASLTALLSIAAAAAEGQSAPWTPADVVRLAIERHPAVVEQRAVVDQRAGQIDEAYSAARPEIELRGSTVRSRDPGLLNSPNFEQLADTGFDPSFLQPIPVTTWDMRVAIDQVVYAFGKVAIGVRAARAAREAEDLRLREARLGVARDALVAYYRLARAEFRRRVIGSEREALEREVRRAADFLEVGAGTRLEWLQARAALSGVRPRELAADGEVREARARLNEAVGRDPLLDVDIDVEAVAEAEVPTVPSLDALVAAVDDRPDLRALARDAEVFERLARVERRTNWPEVRFTGSWGSRAIEAGSLTDGDYASWDAGVYVTWPLYDGRAGRSRSAQYDARRAQTIARAAARRAERVRDLVTAADAYRRGIEAATAADLAVEQAEEARRVAEEESRWGAATTLDVLEAERTLRAARLQRLEALHDTLVAVADVRYQIGILPFEPWPERTGAEESP